MNKIELDIVVLSHSVTQSHNYAIVLGEVLGTRRLPIVIGGFEAQAIAVAMEKMSPNRPLTHDLFKNTLDTFEIELKEVIINNLLDGIFYARLVCISNGEVFEIDSRTSDAIAMAVRYDCPIYTYEFIMEQAGVLLEESEEGAGEAGAKKPGPKKKTKKAPPSIDTMSLPDLQKNLDNALSKEDYKKAAKIRDEINKRNEGGSES